MLSPFFFLELLYNIKIALSIFKENLSRGKRRMMICCIVLPIFDERVSEIEMCLTCMGHRRLFMTLKILWNCRMCIKEMEAPTPFDRAFCTKYIKCI